MRGAGSLGGLRYALRLIQPLGLGTCHPQCGSQQCDCLPRNGAKVADRRVTRSVVSLRINRKFDGWHVALQKIFHLEGKVGHEREAVGNTKGTKITYDALLPPNHPTGSY